jgi:hypothetical protein
MAPIFISYSRKDKDFVRKIGDALAAQKREAWVDWKDIPLTAEWQEEIFTNIEASDNFIFVISPESATSANCRKEIDHAVANNKRMVPIFYRSVPDEAIPGALGKFQRIDFGDNDDFDSKFAALIAALDTDLAWVQIHTRLLTRAKEWEREAKESSFLLRGKDLREAEQWVAKSAEKEPAPTTLQSQYILASRQAATRLQRIVIGAVAAAFVIAAGLAIYAFIQKNVAEDQLARNYWQNSRSARASGNDLGALHFAAKAIRLAPSLRETLLLDLRAIQPSMLRQVFVHQSAVNGARFSRDESRILTWSADGTARLWDAHKGQQIGPALQHQSAVNGALFSRDESRILTWSADKTARLWDARTGQQVGPALQHEDWVSGAVFSGDESRILTWGIDIARLWDAHTGQQIGPALKHTNIVGSAWFSRDGNRILTWSSDHTARLWDAHTGQQIGSTLQRTSIVDGAVFSGDESRILTWSDDHTARLWDALTGKQIGPPLSLQDENELRGVFSGDESRILTWSDDHTARLWDALTDKQTGPAL